MLRASCLHVHCTEHTPAAPPHTARARCWRTLRCTELTACAWPCGCCQHAGSIHGLRCTVCVHASKCGPGTLCTASTGLVQTMLDTPPVCCLLCTLSTAQACMLHACIRRVLTASAACTLCPGHCQCTGSTVREPTVPGPHAHVNYTVLSGPSISLCPCPQLLCPGHPPQPLSGTCSSLPQHPRVPLHSLTHLHGLEGGGVSPCWSMGTRPQCRAVPQASALVSGYGASDTCRAGARTPLATPVSPACPAPRPSPVPSCRGGCWGLPPWGGICR